MSDLSATDMQNKLDSLKMEIDRMRRAMEAQPTLFTAKFVLGRFRHDRIAPTSHSDMLASDKEGDIVRSATHEYIVVNDSGTLKWARSSIDVTW